MNKKYVLFAGATVLSLSIVAMSFSAKTNENKVSDSAGLSTVSEKSSNKSEIGTNASQSDTEKDKNITEIPIKHLDVDTKTNLYSKVLNSIDYYNVINGTIETNMLNQTDEVIEYNVDMSKGTAYQHVLGRDFDEEVFAQDNNVYTIDNLTKTYSVEAAVAKSDEYEEDDVLLGELDVKDRIKYTTADEEETDDAEISESGNELIPVYYYRQNPTNVHYASTVSLFPQEMAFGFLSDENLWDITDKTEFLNRKCTVVEGKTEQGYGEKLNISSFVIIIDDESGVILDFKGYDQQGNITNYTSTKNVSFSSKSIKKLDLSNYSDYAVE
ncbi:MAG: hypothetical protein IJV39_00580 [Ruminococcus sp.]|nr:hypothetical protein [Ruminococcus sp.]